jgi:hypothetical protein
MKIFLAIYFALAVLSVLFIFGATYKRTPSPTDHIADAGKMVEEKK